MLLSLKNNSVKTEVIKFNHTPCEFCRLCYEFRAFRKRFSDCTYPQRGNRLSSSHSLCRICAPLACTARNWAVRYINICLSLTLGKPVFCFAIIKAFTLTSTTQIRKSNFFAALSVYSNILSYIIGKAIWHKSVNSP